MTAADFSVFTINGNADYLKQLPGHRIRRFVVNDLVARPYMRENKNTTNICLDKSSI
ncbi:MAG: hypothetical protein J7K46_03060 [Bacteroidales bacterium]|nr:hypothetical protein [Bacteroidales bacterium]